MITLGVAAAGGFAGATIAGCTNPGNSLGVPLGSAAGSGLEQTDRSAGPFGSSFPVDLQHQIENIIDAKGSTNYGLLQIEIDRNDIHGVTLHGTPILPSFEINGDLNFQALGGNRVIMNSDLCLKADEIDPFIDAMLAHNIFLQAQHQHFYDFDPLVWFIHFRAIGDGVSVARGVKTALNTTSTPFPQAPPKNPTTPLPAAQMGKVIGAKPLIGANGVVAFQVPRAETIELGGNYRSILTSTCHYRLIFSLCQVEKLPPFPILEWFRQRLTP